MSVSVAAGSDASLTRARATGIFFIVAGIAIITLFGFGSDPSAEATFRLDDPRQETFFTLPDLTIPVQMTAYLLGALCAFLGGIQLTRGFGKRVNLVLGIVVFLFVFTFLAWAAGGSQSGTFSFLGMMESTLLRSVPIVFGALSGIMCERSGVVNIAIEGMLLTGAFTGSLVASVSNNLYVGLVAAALVAGMMAALLAVLAIRYRVDQIVAGTVINILALGATSYLSARFLQQNQALNTPGRFQPVEIPILSKIPFIGPILFDNNIFVYLLFILIAVIHIGLFYTRWGLRVRAVGEHPRAADTVGIRVLFTRYRNVILGGMVAGIGGAYFTLGSVGRFDEQMTGGRGFIGLAAMIFGRWNPIGALGAGLVFGFADSLQVKLSILQTPIPTEFLLMAPYLATIFVVAGAVRGARAPAADGKPYIKEG